MLMAMSEPCVTMQPTGSSSPLTNRYTPVPCSQREVCVPALKQLSFLGHYFHCPGPWGSIHQQLDHMHHKKLEHGRRAGNEWGDLPHAWWIKEGNASVEERLNRLIHKPKK